MVIDFDLAGDGALERVQACCVWADLSRWVGGDDAADADESEEGEGSEEEC